MAGEVNVLLLEDEPLDADLIRRALEAQIANLSFEHAQTKEQYLRSLEAKPFDVVISDSSVVGCEGLKSFYLARERQADIPVVYVSGFDGPERDVNGLLAVGVSDFISKSSLDEIGAVVSKAIDDRHAAPAGDVRMLAGYERLVNVVKELSLARNMQTIMRIVRRAARELTGADGATFVLRDGDQCHYADEDAIGPLWKGQRFPMGSCISGWAMIHRQPAVVEDIFTDPRIPVSAYEPTFVRSVVMVPIRALDPIGAIGTYWAKRRLPAVQEVRLLQALADTTSVAMENVRVYSDLERRVHDRTAELEAFAYAVSHDLRTPIRHIRGFAGILREDYAGKLGDGTKVLGRISAAAERMSEMVDALLELSRTERAPVQRRPLDLAALAREIAEECNRTAGSAVEFVAPASLPAEGDPTLLRNALQNLLSNAWKFSAHAAQPRVELGSLGPTSGPPVYYVKDNGAGFDAKNPKVFGVFQRFHAQEEFAGTGVGLATVQRIVRKHDGKIWVESAPAKGAVFYFTLASDSLPALKDGSDAAAS